MWGGWWERLGPWHQRCLLPTLQKRYMPWALLQSVLIALGPRCRPLSCPTQGVIMDALRIGFRGGFHIASLPEHSLLNSGMRLFLASGGKGKPAALGEGLINPG